MIKFNGITFPSSLVRSVHIRYTILPSVFLAYIAIVSVNTNLWIVDDKDHFYFESFAVILSAILGIYCVMRSYALNERFSIFIGIGFLTVALIDLLHATFSYSQAGNNAFLDYFIPQTWFAGRTFLGAMLVIGVARYAPVIRNDFRDNFVNEYNQNKDKTKLNKTLVISLLILSSIATSVVAISFFTIFPGIVTGAFINRPYEIPSIVLFTVALYLFYKKRLYNVSDPFYKGILGALVIDIFGQLIMSYSGINFHTAHNISHMFKISGYIVIILSLAVSSVQYNKLTRQKAETISAQYEKLKEADTMKDEFINIAAHELRTPVQPIIGLTELLASKSYDDPEVNKMLLIVLRNAKRLHKLTEDVLDISKIESNSLKLNVETFNVNDIILNIIDDITINTVELSTMKRLKIIYQPMDIFVSADMMRITQAIFNILNNALKYTEKGIITIGLEMNERNAMVTIKDQGQGIDPAIMPRLFSRFASKSSSGAGMGLFISKSIIEAHGGRIWAENNKDSGATFSFSVPIAGDIHGENKPLHLKAIDAYGAPGEIDGKAGGGGKN